MAPESLNLQERLKAMAKQGAWQSSVTVYNYGYHDPTTDEIPG